jgi:hypothetical protein
VLPPSVIKRLNDHFGDYLIFVRCRSCRHVGEVTPAELAPRVGWDTELAAVIPRLKCSRCGRKDSDVAIAFRHKPRGWSKNPS